MCRFKRNFFNKNDDGEAPWNKTYKYLSVLSKVLQTETELRLMLGIMSCQHGEDKGIIMSNNYAESMTGITRRKCISNLDALVKKKILLKNQTNSGINVYIINYDHIYELHKQIEREEIEEEKKYPPLTMKPKPAPKPAPKLVPTPKPAPKPKDDKYNKIAQAIFDFYPKKVNRKGALKQIIISIGKLVKSGMSGKEACKFLIDKTKKYAEAKKSTEQRYILNPDNFFKDERYCDEESAWNNDDGNSRMCTYKKNMTEEDAFNF